MMVKADLHTHSYCSDGQLSPLDLVKEAQRHEITHLSITDHDSIEAYERLASVNVKDEYGIQLIPGVELTTEYKGRECHLLLYGSRILGDKALLDMMQTTKKHRIDRAKQIIEHLGSLGFDLDLDEVKAEARFGTIGRPHIASIMVKKGWVGSINEAFYRYLKDAMVKDFKPVYPVLEEVLEYANKKSILASIAHPKSRFSEPEIQKFKECGMNGLECIHPSHSDSLTAYLKKTAMKFGLCQSGGSDFHGTKDKCLENFGKYYLSGEKLSALRATIYQLEVNNKEI